MTSDDLGQGLGIAVVGTLILLIAAGVYEFFFYQC